MDALRIALSEYLIILQIVMIGLAFFAVAMGLATAGRLTVRFFKFTLLLGNKVSVPLFIALLPLALLWIKNYQFPPVPVAFVEFLHAPNLPGTNVFALMTLGFYSMGYLLECFLQYLQNEGPKDPHDDDISFAPLWS